MEHIVRTQKELNTMDGIVVASCTVADLFSGRDIKASDGSNIQGKLYIPEYQRPYTWGITQVNRLLKDLNEYANKKAISHLYYMGSVILHQDDKGMLNIVDGQQRLTTLAILAYVNELLPPKIKYSAPSSQQQIAINIHHLEQLNKHNELPELELSLVNITLVVTSDLDNAYRFFETQNTGGVSLTGPQVIKAIHLRAVDDSRRDDNARKWESWLELNDVVSLLMQGRYWNILQPRIYPLHYERQKIKNIIVDELSEQCGEGGDVHYRMVCDKSRTNTIEEGQLYSLRQPLNKGENAIGYLDYFVSLHRLYFIDSEGSETFNNLYNHIISHNDSSPYLKKLFQAASIAYLSRFGDEKLLEAALWIFRMIYSVRVKNIRTVNEKSARAFVRDEHIFDMILLSFTHEELLGRLQRYDSIFNNDNLDKNKTKGRFIRRVMSFFHGKEYKNITQDEIDDFSQLYDKKLKQGIKAKLEIYSA